MSNKKKYKSNLGAQGLITAPNYLVEFVLLRHSKNRGIKLPIQIWNKKYSKNLQWKYWHSLYFGELKRANTLLKTFELKDILMALDTGKGKVILSLSNINLRPIIKEVKAQRELAEKNKEVVEIKTVSPDTLPRSSYGKKSKLGKLR